MHFKNATDLQNISTHFLFNFLFKSFAFKGGIVFLCVLLFTPIFTNAQEVASQQNKSRDGISGFTSEGIYVYGGAIIIDASEEPVASKPSTQTKAEKTQIVSNKKPAAKAPKLMIAEAKKTAKKAVIKPAPQKHMVELPARENPNSFTLNKTKSTVVLQQKHDYVAAVKSADYSVTPNLLYFQTTEYKTGNVVYRFYSRFHCRPPPVS